MRLCIRRSGFRSLGGLACGLEMPHLQGRKRGLPGPGRGTPAPSPAGKASRRDGAFPHGNEHHLLQSGQRLRKAIPLPPDGGFSEAGGFLPLPGHSPCPGHPGGSAEAGGAGSGSRFPLWKGHRRSSIRPGRIAVSGVE